LSIRGGFPLMKDRGKGGGGGPRRAGSVSRKRKRAPKGGEKE